MEKLDKETYQLAKEQEKYKQLVDSDGWAEARKLLLDKLAEMTSVMNIETTNPEEILVEIGARQLARNVMLEWIQEVEGTAAQYKANVIPEQEGQPSFIKEMDLAD